jgi:hypothetical protein
MRPKKAQRLGVGTVLEVTVFVGGLTGGFSRGEAGSSSVGAVSGVSTVM